mmetsp:Transcript_20384/g.37422  ORF Transcript_20384/g.37422 Transcript_20384/m.37422 type:complete len:207 (+) Transcript_20384:196-816(+)
MISQSRINTGGSPSGARTSMVLPMLWGPATCSPVHKCIHAPSGRYTFLLTTPLFTTGTTYTKSPNMNEDTPQSPPPSPPPSFFFFSFVKQLPLNLPSFGKCNIGCLTTGYPLKLASFNNCSRYSDNATYTCDHRVNCFITTSSSYAHNVPLPPLLSFIPHSPSCVRNKVVKAVISIHLHIISLDLESIALPNDDLSCRGTARLMAQ